MSGYLHVRNWDKWQSYRKDRGQPPWIKLHRRLLRDPEFVGLTDAQRGQLVVIWLLAADRDGVIPASPELVYKLCPPLDEPPDLQLFVSLGFLERDANVTPTRRQVDRPEAEAETEAEAERDARAREVDAYTLSAVRGLYGWAGREGTDMRIWNGQDSDDRDRLLTIACARLAAEGRQYSGRFFRAILESVIAEDKTEKTDLLAWFEGD